MIDKARSVDLIKTLTTCVLFGEHKCIHRKCILRDLIMYLMALDSISAKFGFLMRRLGRGLLLQYQPSLKDKLIDYTGSP